MKSAGGVRGGGDCEFLCDTRDIIISVLRFSMKDIPAGAAVRYALERIISAPFLPFCSGSVFVAAGRDGGFQPAAEINMTENLRRISRPVPARGVFPGSAVTVESAGGGSYFCRVFLFYREKLLGVANLFFKPGRSALSAREEGFVCAAANVIAGILTRKAAEDEAFEIRKQLRSSRRLADIGALAASVAHELRSPLAVIKMAASNIRRKSGGKAFAKHLASIDKKVFECDRIISNLLFYSRLKEPEFEKACLYDIILESLRETAPAAGPGIRLRRNLRAVRNIRVEIDPVQIKEVFSNILLNAFESMEGGGLVTVSSSVGDDGRPVVAFRDSGAGMDKDEMKSIFSPFWTTKARGNGLGLTVSESIMKMHGGGIAAESEKGKGSVFRVFFPGTAEERK